MSISGMNGARRRWPVALAIATIVALLPASMAAAHSSVVATSPAQNQSVGGSLTVIEMVFDAGVDDVVIEVESPSGEIVESAIRQDAINYLVIEIAEGVVADEGQWRVNYAFVSADGDPIDDVFTFRYDPEAPQPLPVAGTVSSALRGEGRGWLFWTVSLVLGAVVVVNGGVLVARLRRRKRRIAVSA